MDARNVLCSLLTEETYQFADRWRRMLSLVPAQRRDVESLQNWLDGNGCLAEEESAYLSHHRELVSLAPAGDSAIMQLEAWVEDRLIQLWRKFRKAWAAVRYLDQANHCPGAFPQPVGRSKCLPLFRPMDPADH